MRGEGEGGGGVYINVIEDVIILFTIIILFFNSPV